MYNAVESDSTVELEIPLDVEESSMELECAQIECGVVTKASTKLPQKPLPDPVPPASF